MPAQASLSRIRSLVKIAKQEGLSRLVVGDVTIEPGVVAQPRPSEEKQPEYSQARLALANYLRIDPSLVDEDTEKAMSGTLETVSTDA